MAYWDIDTAVYSGKSLYIGSLITGVNGLFFKPDGLIVYISDFSESTLYQFTLSVAWDIDTAVYSGKSLDVVRQDGYPSDLFFKPDGAILYMLGNDNDTVFQYDLSSSKNIKRAKPPSPGPIPWDISTAEYNKVKLDISAQNTYPWGFFFNSDGSKFYTLDTSNDTIHEYNLSIPWIITSGLYSGNSFYVGFQDIKPYNIAFSVDGSKFYIPAGINKNVYQYTLIVPWELSSAVYSNLFLYIGYQDVYPYGIFFKPDGSRLYIAGVNTDTIYQYNIPEGPVIPPKKEASRTGVYSFKTLS
ncbi:hypothetical protein ES705_16795 [subsurface metagenome]